jgi:hypothetical protein
MEQAQGMEQVAKSHSNSKKRKKVSDAERIALELFKVTSRQPRQSKVKFDQNKIIFEDTKMNDTIKGESCCWANPGRPIYCSDAEFRFETCLPEREYLTRFSVSCNKCRPSDAQAFHLYCSYCDEILSGSIAGPGGKIADHVVTIRHIVKEAVVQNQHLEKMGRVSAEEFQKAATYVTKLEQWSGAIRFKRNSEEKREFEQVLCLLQQLLRRYSAPCCMVCIFIHTTWNSTLS